MYRGADRWRFYGLVGAEVLRAFRGRLIRGLSYLALVGRPRPTALLITPQDLRTSDPTVATDIYGGRFVFAGRALTTRGRSPFDFAPPSPEWGDAFYGFGWLRHLRAADDALARANARALVQDYVEGRGDRHAARAPRVTARRLVSFLNQSPVVLEGADHAFYRAYLRAIEGCVRDLERWVRGGLPPGPRLSAAVALTYAGLCCEGLSATLRRGSRLLARELDRQILPDGGHLSRDPHFAASLMLDLLPLRQSFLSRDVEPPPALVRAIDRVLPHLRYLRHPDGSLSHFNGAGASAADHLATLLVYDASVGRPMRDAPHSAYARLEAGGTLVVADVGRPPPLIHSAAAGAGCLAFELSVGAARLVVNCGLPRSGAEARHAARLTAAHSTVTIAETSSARILAPGGWWLPRAAAAWLTRRIGPVILRAPPRVTARREDSDGPGFVASHDGYRRRHGIVHERRLRLAPDGARVEGEDAFALDPGRGPRAAAIRFHLHPGVRASRDPEGVALALPGGEVWLFASETEAVIEDSVFFAAVTGARRTEQIVLHLELTASTRLRWSFERRSAPPGAAAKRVPGTRERP